MSKANNELSSLDRLISLNWRHPEIKNRIETQIAKSEIDRIKHDRVALFQAYNGMCKAMHISDCSKLRSKADEALHAIMSSLSSRPMVVNRSSIDLSQNLSYEKEFSSVAIVATDVNTSVQLFSTYCVDVLGCAPQVYLVSFDERNDCAPWAFNGAWYGPKAYNPSTTSVNISVTAEVGNWSGLRQLLRSLDGVLIMAIGLPIVPKWILDDIQCTLLNLHNGLLPNIRGLDSPAWSIVTDTVCGSTLHVIEPGVDRGRVLSRVSTDIALGKNSYTEAKCRLWQDAIRRDSSGIKLVWPEKKKSLSMYPDFHSMHENLRRLLNCHVMLH